MAVDKNQDKKDKRIKKSSEKAIDRRHNEILKVKPDKANTEAFMNRGDNKLLYFANGSNGYTFNRNHRRISSTQDDIDNIHWKGDEISKRNRTKTVDLQLNRLSTISGIMNGFKAAAYHQGINGDLYEQGARLPNENQTEEEKNKCNQAWEYVQLVAAFYTIKFPNENQFKALEEKRRALEKNLDENGNFTMNVQDYYKYNNPKAFTLINKSDLANIDRDLQDLKQYYEQRPADFIEKTKRLLSRLQECQNISDIRNNNLYAELFELEIDFWDLIDAGCLENNPELKKQFEALHFVNQNLDILLATNYSHDMESKDGLQNSVFNVVKEKLLHHFGNYPTPTDNQQRDERLNSAIEKTETEMESYQKKLSTSKVRVMSWLAAKPGQPAKTQGALESLSGTYSNYKTKMVAQRAAEATKEAEAVKAKVEVEATEPEEAVEAAADKAVEIQAVIDAQKKETEIQQIEQEYYARINAEKANPELKAARLKAENENPDLAIARMKRELEWAMSGWDDEVESTANVDRQAAEEQNNERYANPLQTINALAEEQQAHKAENVVNEAQDEHDDEDDDEDENMTNLRNS